jgi:hypothetical protein
VPPRWTDGLYTCQAPKCKCPTCIHTFSRRPGPGGLLVLGFDRHQAVPGVRDIGVVLAVVGEVPGRVVDERERSGPVSGDIPVDFCDDPSVRARILHP